MATAAMEPDANRRAGGREQPEKRVATAVLPCGSLKLAMCCFGVGLLLVGIYLFLFTSCWGAAKSYLPLLNAANVQQAPVLA